MSRDRIRVDAWRARRREEALRRGINPRDVDLLLAHATGRSPAYLFAHGEMEIDPSEADALVDRRHAGEPVQYIRGLTEFFGREFQVDERALIPRPETELVVEAVLERAPRQSRVVDLGTGSGCIAITLQCERPDLRVTGIDISFDALTLARRNARTLGATVGLAASDALNAIRHSDVIVANPPYIPGEDIPGLAAEVRDYEPRCALTPGPSGLEMIERIAAECRRALVVLEIGFGQEAAVRRIFAAHARRVDAVLPDLGGIPRVVVSSP